MQSSPENTVLDGSRRNHDRMVQEKEASGWARMQNVDHYPHSDAGTPLSAEFFEQCCTLDSSSGACGHTVSTSSFSPDESAASHPNSQSYPSDQQDSPEYACSSSASEAYVSHKMRELETAMLGRELDNVATCDSVALSESDQITSEAEKWAYLTEMTARGDLKEMLCSCARAIEDNDLLTFEWLMTQLRQMVSVSGEPIQRLGAYMLEGLVARLASSGSSIYKALKCKEPASAELLSYMHLLYEACPYFKFGYLSANGAIAEATKNENRIHIIDFQIAQGTQWVTLIQALAARPGGPPHVCITGIDDSTSAYARGGGLHLVGQRLSSFAGLNKVPFEFRVAEVSASEIHLQHLDIRPNEALAINFPLMLHHMPDESVGTHNHRDRLLRLVKSLSPRVVTLIEQESNTNTAPFVARFIETMNCYLAIFESIDVTLPRDHKERINVEQHCLAREVVNLIACEGGERVERHELLGKWRSRFAMAGFSPYPLSSVVNATIKTLLASYSDKYTLQERNGVLYLGWMNRPLITSSAWR